MPRFAANLSMMYNEVPFLERFAAAAKDGFKAFECLFPYEFDAKEIRRRMDDAGLINVLFNGPPGDWSKGERGLASLPGREDEFKRSIDTALKYAQTMGTPTLHVMCGLIAADDDRAKHRETYIRNLRWAAEQCAGAGVTAVIEPINTRDIPGMFLNYQADAHAVVQAVGASNLKVQMDLYHCQIVEGDLAMRMRQYLPTGHVGHMQIAGVPQRHEPDVGELNYPYLFEVIDELGYTGWIGCEYRPKGHTSAGLGWVKPYLK
jgi:hydroxypyruvate isomerase